MPLANECMSAPALCPSPVGEILMPGIVSIKPESCAAVAAQRLRTLGNLDMGISVATDQNSSGLRRVLRAAQVAIDSRGYPLVDDDEPQACAEDH